MSSPNRRLIEAAAAGDVGAIRAALADGAEALDHALSAACYQNQVTAAAYLIDLGANVNEVPKALPESEWQALEDILPALSPPFCIAFNEGHADIILLLLNKRTSFSMDMEVLSIYLELAITIGDAELVEAFFSYEEDLNKWKLSNNLLPTAIINRDKNMAKILVSRGIKIDTDYISSLDHNTANNFLDKKTLIFMEKIGQENLVFSARKHFLLNFFKPFFAISASVYFFFFVFVFIPISLTKGIAGITDGSFFLIYAMAFSMPCIFLVVWWQQISYPKLIYWKRARAGRPSSRSKRPACDARERRG